MWNKTECSLVSKTVENVPPPHLYIRNRIVQWAFDPVFAMMAHDVGCCSIKKFATMTYVGIDVSKATFVVAYSSAKIGRTRTFKNTVKGVREFIQTVSASGHHCVLCH